MFTLHGWLSSLVFSFIRIILKFNVNSVYSQKALGKVESSGSSSQLCSVGLEMEKKK